MTGKLRSSSIYYALFLSVVIGILLGAILLFSHSHRTLNSQLEVKDKLMNNAYSGIAYAQSNHKEFKVGISQPIRLFNEGIDSVTLLLNKWGAYSILLAKAQHKKVNFSKISLSGTRTLDKTALYLCDYGRPLSVCGETRLENDCYLPTSGVKRAYIGGKNYIGKKLVYGNAKNAKNTLPEIDPSILENFTLTNSEIKEWEDRIDTITNSFSNKAVKYIGGDFISIKNQVISGQIMIEARDSIFIGADSQISDIIIKCPIVYIQSGFQGNIQIFASNRVTLEKNVLLKYPSVITLIENTFPEKHNSEIIIGEQSQVIGTILLLSKTPNFRKPVQLSIAEKAEVDGLIYCKGRTELKGIVNGNLYTERFYLTTTASSYENHLLDATIKNDLPLDFVVADIFQKSENLTTIAWVN